MKTNEILKKYNPEKDNILQILHDIQNNNPKQYITEDDMKKVADYINISYSSVFGVVTYYSMFSTRPRGKYIIRCCNSPVCNMMGSEDIIDELKESLSVDINDTTKDGLFCLEKSECLGRCNSAPVMFVNENIEGNLGRNKIEKIINYYK